MSAGLLLVLAAVGAAAASYIFTGVAVRVALATDFVDRPRGYKAHAAATPYLGGAAVACAVLAAVLLLADANRALIAVLGAGAALAVVGTIDDRIAVAPRWRVALELAAAGLLFSVGVHWSPSGNAVLDFLLTAAWVVGIVNAFNLMDNIDGAAATVTLVSAGALGVIAILGDHIALAVVALAVMGACAGFLPHNLASPARIFLGDGGSMPLGFLIAALSMLAFDGGSLGASAALGGALVAGLPILDTTLVVISRHRRGVPFVTGGRDHLTHRLLSRVGSARVVALLLAGVQSVLVGLSLVSSQLGPWFCVPAALLVGLAGLRAIAVLESPAWPPGNHFQPAGHGKATPRRVAGPPTPVAPLPPMAPPTRASPAVGAPVVDRPART